MVGPRKLSALSQEETPRPRHTKSHHLPQPSPPEQGQRVYYRNDGHDQRPVERHQKEADFPAFNAERMKESTGAAGPYALPPHVEGHRDGH